MVFCALELQEPRRWLFSARIFGKEVVRQVNLFALGEGHANPEELCHALSEHTSVLKTCIPRSVPSDLTIEFDIGPPGAMLAFYDGVQARLVAHGKPHPAQDRGGWILTASCGRQIVCLRDDVSPDTDLTWRDPEHRLSEKAGMMMHVQMVSLTMELSKVAAAWPDVPHDLRSGILVTMEIVRDLFDTEWDTGGPPVIWDWWLREREEAEARKPWNRLKALLSNFMDAMFGERP